MNRLGKYYSRGYAMPEGNLASIPLILGGTNGTQIKRVLTEDSSNGLNAGHSSYNEISYEIYFFKQANILKRSYNMRGRIVSSKNISIDSTYTSGGSSYSCITLQIEPDRENGYTGMFTTNKGVGLLATPEEFLGLYPVYSEEEYYAYLSEYTPPIDDPAPIDDPVEEATTYDLWLGAKRVTSANREDILGDGRASYDPESGTLSLDEPVIPGIVIANEDSTMKIFASDIDLTITGKYHMSAAEADYGVAAVNGKLNLYGDFKLVGERTGAYSNGEMCLNGDLCLEGGAKEGLFCLSDVNILGGSVRVTSSGGICGLRAKGCLRNCR